MNLKRGFRWLGGMLAAAFTCLPLHAQEVLVPYGDMDQWVVRQIKESAIIGGNVKTLYEVAPSDTVVGAVPYENQGGSPWATSNVLAKVVGVVKTNTSVFPEKRDDGWCVRMETRMEQVKVFGLINIEVLAAGSLFFGTVHEPIRGITNPQSNLQNGVPFTEKPKAIKFDYKVKVMPEMERTRSTEFGKKSKVPGQDSVAVVLLLQKRWEDEDGNVFSKRVGTMVQRYYQSQLEWVNGATYPILYGDITNLPEYRDYMRIQVEERYTTNSKGDRVPIQEVGWADADETPTHMVLQFVSSHGGAYVGSIGNTFWVDNVKFVY